MIHGQTIDSSNRFNIQGLMYTPKSLLLLLVLVLAHEVRYSNAFRAVEYRDVADQYALDSAPIQTTRSEVGGLRAVSCVHSC